MNKKLRLLVTEKCQNNCKLCCNRQFDLKSLPVVSRLDYDEISITGGEPLLFTTEVNDLYESIKRFTDICLGKEPKIYVYTSIFDYNKINRLAGSWDLHIDGFTMTPHNVKDIHDLYILNEHLIMVNKNAPLLKRSFRLCLFPEMRKELEKYNMDLSLWQVKDIEWLENCPLPEGEDFCRIENLFQ